MCGAEGWQRIGADRQGRQSGISIAFQNVGGGHRDGIVCTDYRHVGKSDVGPVQPAVTTDRLGFERIQAGLRLAIDAIDPALIDLVFRAAIAFIRLRNSFLHDSMSKCCRLQDGAPSCTGYRQHASLGIIGLQQMVDDRSTIQENFAIIENQGRNPANRIALHDLFEIVRRREHLLLEIQAKQPQQCGCAANEWRYVAADKNHACFQWAL